MGLSDFRRYVLGACLVALLAACGGPGSRSGAGAVPQRPATATHSESGRSWMASDAKRGNLLYVSDTQTSDVYVFSYPNGKLKGTLTGLADPAGECVDKSGDVFVTNTGDSNIVEYAHGGTSPIATLKDGGYFPVGCSVDPITGNLAVTNFSTTSSTQGDVVIYKGATGRPRGHYVDPDINGMLLCGYDDAGNLFVDGLDTASASKFAELPSGSTSLITIALNQSIGSPGGVQWDGKHLAIGDQTTNAIYRFRMSGNTGTLVGSTPLKGATQVFQFWIAGSNVIGPDAGAADIGIWSYPAGGSPVKTIPGVYVPLGATLSKAP
jgi:hypothetical protein